MAAMKKGFFFTIDALLAASILLGGILLLSSNYVSNKPNVHLNYFSQDIINSLNNLRINELNNDYVDELILNGNITDTNNTVLQQLGEFWALEKSNISEKFIENITYDILPIKFGFGVYINNYMIYERISPSPSSRASARIIISGYEKSKPIEGISSRAYLKSIKERKTYAFAYFGGFVGQGNISRQLEYIPADANISEAILEVDAESSFDISINDVFCANFIPAAAPEMTAEIFNITSCKGLFLNGTRNNISLDFLGDLSDAFIAGGKVRVKYSTREFSDPYNNSRLKYYFPGIIGIANLYSSFYVPGILESMSIHLRFKSNYSTYLTIGNTEVFQNNGSEIEQTVDIDNSTLSSLLNYQSISQTTVPIRFASYNLVNETVLTGNADIILITDYSGSMKKAVSDWSQGSNGPKCDDYFDDPDTRRTIAAKCLDKELVDIVMNYTGNRVWPVFIEDDDIKYLDDPDDPIAIKNYIDTFGNGRGKTCIACAINKGYDILEQYSDSSRKKFMVLMTDGCPTHCASGSCTSNSSSFGTQQCEGLCDQTGGCDESNIPSQCTECINNPGAIDNAYFSAQRARDNLNVTIYTIGFGPVNDCSLAPETLLNISIIGNGTYQQSNDTSVLKEIYENISNEILALTEQSSQSVIVRGGLNESNLYPDSYIEMNYAPIVSAPGFGEIVFSMETPKLKNCTDNITIFPKINIIDAKVVSYSGSHWTTNVTVNNNNVFLLQNYSYNFLKLGDPYNIYIPPPLFKQGNNTITIITGDDPINSTGCSLNNSLIYKATLPISTAYGPVLAKSEGCNWTIETEDFGFINLFVPSNYAGSKLCNYTGTSVNYDSNDSIDVAVYSLISNLDFDDNFKININIEEEDLEIDPVQVFGIPSLWGPAIMEVRVWN